MVERVLVSASEKMAAAMTGAVKVAFVALFKWIGSCILTGSYWICLFACIAALLLYIAGMKKAAKYIPISFFLFFILQSFKAFFGL